MSQKEHSRRDAKARGREEKKTATHSAWRLRDFASWREIHCFRLSRRPPDEAKTQPAARILPAEKQLRHPVRVSQDDIHSSPVRQRLGERAKAKPLFFACSAPLREIQFFTQRRRDRREEPQGRGMYPARAGASGGYRRCWQAQGCFCGAGLVSSVTSALKASDARSGSRASSFRLASMA